MPSLAFYKSGPALHVMYADMIPEMAFPVLQSDVQGIYGDPGRGEGCKLRINRETT